MNTGNHFILPCWTLWKREVVRFLRQRNRVIGALGTPVIFWLLIGSGVGQAFAAPGLPSDTDYLQFFFPGALLMIILFTAIFSTISIIEDRREGFLQGVLVAPVSPTAVALGKILGGTTLAVGQALLFCLLAPLVGLTFTLPGFAILFLMLILVSLALTSLGYVLAWMSNSVQGYHAIMNLVLFPLWLLSGTLFTRETAAGWMGAVIAINPLTYGLDAIRSAVFLHELGLNDTATIFGRGVAAMIFVSAVLITLSGWMTERTFRA
jgi:ABC-2 type transport system permease protein